MRESDWYKSYSDSYLWGRIEETQAALLEFDSDDEAEAAHARFLERILRQLLKRRESPSLFVTEKMLDEADDGVLELKKQVESGSLYISTRDASNRQVTELYFPDEMMEAFSKWPVGSRDNLQSAAQTLRHAAEKLKIQVDQFREQSQSLEEQLATTIKEHTSDFEVRIADILTDFGKIQESVNETSSEIAIVRAQTEKLIEDQTERFREAEKNNQEELKKALNASTLRVNNIIHSYELKLEKLQSEMDGIKERAANMVRIVSTSFVSDAHQTEADAQKQSADEYRNRGVWALAAAAIIAVVIGADLANTESPDFMVLVRFSATFTLGLIGWYLLRESSRHRDQEYAARTMELKLRALTPFIEDLDDKDEIIEAAAHHFFDITPIPVSPKKTAPDPNDLRYQREEEED